MDNYRGVALGVEAAWPGGFELRRRSRMLPRIFAALGVVLALLSGR